MGPPSPSRLRRVWGSPTKDLDAETWRNGIAKDPDGEREGPHLAVGHLWEMSKFGHGGGPG